MASSLFLCRLGLPALLLLVVAAPAGPARAGLFVGASAGPSLLREEGHAPPLCCNERENWNAPGARVGGRFGYEFVGPLRIGVDLGVALYQVPGLELRVFSPDAGATVTGQLRLSVVTVELGAGAGWRHFSGTAHLGTSDRAVSKGAVDLRATIGVHARAGSRHSLGAELTIAKVLIEQTVATLSFVIGWDIL